RRRHTRFSRDWSSDVCSSDLSNGYFQAVIGSGKDYGGTTITNFYGYDDIYIDFTQARVEICDSPSWTGRTHCEIQIPQTWSSTADRKSVVQGKSVEMRGGGCG